ncbi:MAG: hypothetical protein VX408_08035, partial [Pseudomonadota bacterium]|nr:hypothetical protein [Pseudomonadota bacterium]
MSRLPMSSVAASCSLLLFTCSIQAHADSMSALIAQKSVQSDSSARYMSSYPAVPSVKVSTHSTIQRARSPSYSNDSMSSYGNQPALSTTYRYPEMQRQAPTVLPAFLSGSYDNVDSEYLPLLSSAETQSSMAAREVVSTARKMALNERTIIKG